MLSFCLEVHARDEKEEYMNACYSGQVIKLKAIATYIERICKGSEDTVLHYSIGLRLGSLGD
jgi:hypothetical protein